MLQSIEANWLSLGGAGVFVGLGSKGADLRSFVALDADDVGADDGGGSMDGECGCETSPESEC
jgi:hypothetical protein